MARMGEVNDEVSTVDYYQLLGVDRSAVPVRHQIRVPRQGAAHPPGYMGGSGTDFHALHEAYQALVDPIRRAAYDRSLRWSVPRSQPMPSHRAGNWSTAPVWRRAGRSRRAVA